MNTNDKTAEGFKASMGLIPIRIRKDLVVYVQGIPHDLKKSEAAKICTVINAYTQHRSR